MAIGSEGMAKGGERRSSAGAIQGGGGIFWHIAHCTSAQRRSTMVGQNNVGWRRRVGMGRSAIVTEIAHGLGCAVGG